MDLPVLTLAVLAAVAFAAGVIDAIAGGGGLLTLPALLAAGLEPHFALGTNKGQSVFGSFASLVRFARAGRVNRAQAKKTFPAGFVGALVGAALVLAVDPAVLRPLVLVLLVAAGAFITLWKPKQRAADDTSPHPRYLALIIALIVGTYDGFFGPGTGTFLIVLFVGLLGESTSHATADAKVVNFAANLATVLVMAASGKVLWAISLPMALGQFCGGLVGAQLAIKGGDRLIKAMVLLVVIALVLKLAFDLWRPG